MFIFRSHALNALDAAYFLFDGAKIVDRGAFFGRKCKCVERFEA